MTNIIRNSYPPSFQGLKYNNSLKQAKEYAISTGQKDLFKYMRNLVNSYSGDSLSINVRANKRPFESMHITILNKNLSSSPSKDEYIGKIEYSYPGNDPIGKAAFNVLRNLADKTTQTHKLVFNK